MKTVQIKGTAQRDSMLGHLLSSMLYTIVTVVLLGFVYPLVVTGLAHLIFPHQAEGSLILNAQGAVVGSELVGQNFSKPEYFHPRPSAAGNGYDPTASSGTNLGPTSKKLMTTTQATFARTIKENQATTAPPADLVSSSASGLDPDISPEAAAYQIGRVAQARHLSQETVRSLVTKYTIDRDLGIFGEPHVHVVDLNIALDKKEKN